MFVNIVAKNSANQDKYKNTEEFTLVNKPLFWTRIIPKLRSSQEWKIIFSIRKNIHKDLKEFMLVKEPLLVDNVTIKESKGIKRNKKPFACKYFDKKFSLSGQILRHEIIHTSLKPYSFQST